MKEAERRQAAENLVEEVIQGLQDALGSVPCLNPEALDGLIPKIAKAQMHMILARNMGERPS